MERARVPEGRNHYDVLGIAPSASADEIRFAYRRLARIVHPDRHRQGPLGETIALREAMAEINEAWAVLSDPVRRRAYDAELGSAAAPAGLDGARPRPAAFANPWSTRAGLGAASGTSRLLAVLGVAVVLAAGWQLRRPAPRGAPASNSRDPVPSTVAPRPSPAPAPRTPTGSTVPPTSVPPSTTPPATTPTTGAAPKPLPLVTLPHVSLQCTTGGPQVEVAAGATGLVLTARNPRPHALVTDLGTTTVLTTGGVRELGGSLVVELRPGEAVRRALGPGEALSVVSGPRWRPADGLTPCP